MDQFNKEEPSQCPQCNGDAGFDYHKEGRHVSFGVGDGPLLCPTEESHMHRICNICGYEWAEAPLV